jgi:hypothetical protein
MLINVLACICLAFLLLFPIGVALGIILPPEPGTEDPIYGRSSKIFYALDDGHWHYRQHFMLNNHKSFGRVPRTGYQENRTNSAQIDEG